MLKVLTILSTALSLVAVYTGVIALFTFKKRVPYAKTAPKTRFLVIIPARNEESVIANLIAALRRQDYPKEKFDIVVAANNCTDHTAEASRAAGVSVFECTGAITCKGDVLHQVIERYLPEKYDAFAFFDADNLPDPGFLSAMNDALCAGERVCKCRLKAGNAFDSWVSGNYGIYHAMMEWVFSRPHAAAGFSSNLVGTGYVVHREVFERLGGWNTKSMCEDSEFGAICASIGVRVAWVYEALSYDEQVTGFWTSMRQRLRWCSGMVEAAHYRLPALLKSDVPKRGVALDFAMTFILAHTQPLATVLMILALPWYPKWMFLTMGASACLSAIGIMLLSVLMCKLGGYPIKKMVPAILLSPIFMVSWAPLQILALVTPVKRWSPIAHTGQDDVEKAA